MFGASVVLYKGRYIVRRFTRDEVNTAIYVILDGLEMNIFIGQTKDKVIAVVNGMATCEGKCNKGAMGWQRIEEWTEGYSGVSENEN